MTDTNKRTIRSFVKRQGRITTGQKHALTELYAQYGIDLSKGTLNLPELFGREAPVVLEIGCGNGDTMIELASQHPELNFIGAEVYQPGVGRLLANVHKNSLANVRVVMHDAVELLEHNIAQNSLSKILIYFPDPWHKKRHHKRRLVNPQFVNLITTKLHNGGELHLATDWENYAEQMQRVCDQAEHLQNTNPEGGPVARPEWRPLTKFEQRGERLGHGVWDFIYQRV